MVVSQNWEPGKKWMLYYFLLINWMIWGSETSICIDIIHRSYGHVFAPDLHLQARWNASCCAAVAWVAPKVREEEPKLRPPGGFVSEGSLDWWPLLPPGSTARDPSTTARGQTGEGEQWSHQIFDQRPRLLVPQRRLHESTLKLLMINPDPKR